MRLPRPAGPILSSFLLLGAPSCSKGGNGPRLEFEATFHDFGTLATEDKGAHVYRGWNTGGAELVIRTARASCGCAVPDLVAIGKDGLERRGATERTGDVLRLAPGETLEVRLAVDPRVGAASGVPEIHGNVLLETSEVGRPYLRLEFHVRFDVPVNVTPPSIDVEAVGRRERVVKEILLVPTLGRTFDISPPDSLPPGVTADLRLEERPGKGGATLRTYRLRVTLGPGLPEGFLSTVLLLPTGYREGHRIEIPLRARVVGDLLLHPAGFELGIVRPSSADDPTPSPGRRVAVRYTPAGKTLRLGEPRVEGDESAHLKASLREIEVGRRFEVLLEPGPGIAAPVFKGSVVIPTDDPENPEIKIPYRGFAREG
ncbi:MAG: DUF1573 domain-containing protein [Planctomycetes bacterium]|nr:DUF1573 domain-containing protein [Planctomycetota bacterium]